MRFAWVVSLYWIKKLFSAPLGQALICDRINVAEHKAHVPVGPSKTRTARMPTTKFALVAGLAAG